MRWLPALALLLPLAGCASWTDDGCPSAPAQATVERVDGLDLDVRLEDGSPAVIHLHRSNVYRLEGGECVPAEKTGIPPGQRIAYYATEQADSYPPQMWPPTVLLLG